ncbi:hypothetical protein AX774_g6154 [Zancudomyces culisetae]|uniref:Uncharacterized protein n=1 Tax=Zancudomyces culisetae TaxID=1213189 RepID=A0A1R1PHD0_ZANCU|nr:hypothetical protein AX774_g6154 [Zancudomyces culisetae]|eukprot:OMH80405.1 hypothetical protein AX774_g6154 [Zancudomyces culisetae]
MPSSMARYLAFAPPYQSTLHHTPLPLPPVSPLLLFPPPPFHTLSQTTLSVPAQNIPPSSAHAPSTAPLPHSGTYRTPQPSPDTYFVITNTLPSINSSIFLPHSPPKTLYYIPASPPEPFLSPTISLVALSPSKSCVNSCPSPPLPPA